MKFKLRKFKRGDEISLQKNIDHEEIAKSTLYIPYPYTLKNAKYWVKRNLKLNKQKKTRKNTG